MGGTVVLLHRAVMAEAPLLGWRGKMNVDRWFGLGGCD
jgi:hypothetical protein